MEKKLVKVEEKVHEKKSKSDEATAAASSSENEEDFDEFDWRKKS